MDAASVNKTLQGDLKAFEELVTNHQKSLYYTAYRILHDEAAAEDVVQEAFVQAFNNLKTLREPAGFYAWIKKITINYALNRLSRDKKMVHQENDDDESIFFEKSSSLPSPEDYTINEEMHSIVNQMVDNLPEKFRMVVLMKEYEDLSYEEIAEVLKVPVDTVRSRLFNARSLLKEMFVRKGYEEMRYGM